MVLIPLKLIGNKRREQEDGWRSPVRWQWLRRLAESHNELCLNSRHLPGLALPSCLPFPLGKEDSLSLSSSMNILLAVLTKV